MSNKDKTIKTIEDILKRDTKELAEKLYTCMIHMLGLQNQNEICKPGKNCNSCLMYNECYSERDKQNNQKQIDISKNNRKIVNTDWMTAKEIMETYGVNHGWVYRQDKLLGKRQKVKGGKTYFDRKKVDDFFQNKMTAKEIVKSFEVSDGFVYNHGRNLGKIQYEKGGKAYFDRKKVKNYFEKK